MANIDINIGGDIDRILMLNVYSNFILIVGDLGEIQSL